MQQQQSSEASLTGRLSPVNWTPQALARLERATYDLGLNEQDYLALIDAAVAVAQRRRSPVVASEDFEDGLDRWAAAVRVRRETGLPVEIWEDDPAATQPVEGVELHDARLDARALRFCLRGHSPRPFDPARDAWSVGPQYGLQREEVCDGCGAHRAVALEGRPVLYNPPINEGRWLAVPRRRR